MWEPGLPLHEWEPIVRPASLALFLGALATLSVIDMRVQRLPDKIVLPMLWLGLGLNAGGLLTSPTDAILGALCGYLSLWLLSTLYSFRRRAAFGGGDLKLAAMLGAWLGATSVPATLLVAFSAGSAICVPLLLLGKRRMGERIPFGPALALGGVAALFAGPTAIFDLFAFAL